MLFHVISLLMAINNKLLNEWSTDNYDQVDPTSRWWSATWLFYCIVMFSAVTHGVSCYTIETLIYSEKRGKNERNFMLLKKLKVYIYNPLIFTNICGLCVDVLANMTCRYNFLLILYEYCSVQISSLFLVNYVGI